MLKSNVKGSVYSLSSLAPGVFAYDTLYHQTVNNREHLWWIYPQRRD